MDDCNRPTIAELEKILGSPNAPAVEITTAGEVVVKGLRYEIEQAVNRVSAENGSNTPDFILAGYLVSCLAAFDRAVNDRERWYGRVNDGSSWPANPEALPVTQGVKP